MKTRKKSRLLVAYATCFSVISLTGCEETAETAISTSQPTSISNCTPGYSPCLPLMSDYDCKGGLGDGPGFTGRVEVSGEDQYGLDRDRNGIGCD
jgi:hypothetical protein